MLALLYDLGQRKREKDRERLERDAAVGRKYQYSSNVTAWKRISQSALEFKLSDEPQIDLPRFP